MLQKVIVDPTPKTSDDVVITFGGKAYVLDNSGVYHAQTLASNGVGEAVFSGLPLGAYLISDQSAVGAAQPLLVGIPTIVTGASEPALYDIDVYPKTIITPPPAEPEPYVPEVPDAPDPVVKPVKPVQPDISEENDEPRTSENIPSSGAGSDAKLAWLPEIQESEAADELSDVGSHRIPLGGFNLTNAWSLLSLMMSLIAILLSIVLIVRWIARRRNEEEDEDENDDEEEEEKTYRNAYIARTLTIIFGILTPIVFLILDDMRLPMVWINKWTPYVGLVFLIHIALFIVYKLRNKEKDPNESEQGP
jgi:hypothetical protein